MPSKAEVILVKYNQPEMEAETVRTVLETAGHKNYTLTTYQNRPGVGLAACWNRLIAASDADHIVLLNTDTVPTPDWLEDLTIVLDQNPDVMAVVPSSNKVHLSQIPVPFEDFAPAKEEIFAFAARLNAHKVELCELPTASAMCVAFRRTAWDKAGGFDEDFFLYGEDTEFFYRLRKLGRVVWHRGVYVHHYGQQSMIKAVQDGHFCYEAVRANANELWLRKKERIDNE